MANEVKLKLAIEGGQVVNATIDGVTTRIGALDDKARAAASGSDALGSALKGLITVGAAMAMIKMADSVTTLQTQLRLSSNSAAEAGKAYGALFDIAQKGRVSFTELGTTYAAVARSGRELGISQDRLLNVTKSISQAMTIGGGSAASMQAALVQLGQGLSSGVLRGEELNSIMEQTPRLAKAIADGLGVPIGKLRELGAAGELTSQQVISALEKAGPALAKEMESATLTVGQAFTMLGNSTVKFVGDADKATGASTTLATAMKSASEAMDTVGMAIKNNETAFAIVTYGLAGPATVAGVYALSVAIGTRLIPALIGAAAAAGPLGWITIALSAMGGAAVAASNAFTKSNQGMAISAAQLANQIAAIDKNAAAGLNDRGYKASEEDKRASAARRDELTEKKKLIDQAMAMRTADEGSAAAAQSSRSAHSKLAKDAIKDREDFAKAGEAYMSKGQKNQKLLNDEIEKNGALLAKGSITAAQYGERINAVRASFEKKVATGGITEAAKGLSLFNDLVDKSNGLTATYAEDQSKLTAAYRAQKITLDEYQVVMTALIKQQPYMQEAEKLRLELAKENTKAVDDLFEAQEKLRLKNEDSIKTSRTMLEQIEFETRLLEMNAEQRAQATMERELERQGIVKGTLAYDAYIVRLREAMALKTGKEAGIKAADDLREAQKKAAEESGKYWEDALMRAFESGKGFFQSLWDTIKNTLKTQVLKVAVQGVMGTLGIGASAAAMAGGAGSDIFGLANTANTLSSLYSSASSIVTIGSQVAAGTMGVANALGTLAANATGTGISGLLAANGAYGTAAAGTASAAAGGMTGMLAAIPGWGWAALGVAALAGIASGRGETRSGAAYVTGANGLAAYQQGPSGGEIAGSEARRLFTVATDSINAALAAVGSKAKLTGFVAGLESSKNGKGFDYAGGYINGVSFGESGGRDGGQFAYKSQTAEQAFSNYTVQLKQATVQALQAATDVPKTIKDMLSSVDANALTGEAVDALLGNINAVVGMVNSFNQAVLSLPFDNLKNLSFDAAAGLLAVTGGLDKLGANLSAYYELFYSDAERLATTTTNVSTALRAVGVAMPTTKDAFRDIVTGLDLTSESGRNAYAVMLAVAPEFAKVADTAQTAADASVKLMTEVFDALDKRLTDLVQSIASERDSVAGARDSILSGGVKTYSQLQAGVTAAKVALPSDALVLSAVQAQATAASNMAAKQSALTSAQSSQATWQGYLATVTANKTAAIDLYKGFAGQIHNLASSNGYAVNSSAVSGGAVDMRNTGGVYDPATEKFTSVDYRSYNSWDSLAGINATTARYLELKALVNSANGVIAIHTKEVAAYASALASTVTVTASAQAALTTATAAKAAADAAAKTAILAYADAMTQYSGDAEKAVKVLSKLREETVAYYEAQKALASTMTASAANLREAVRSTQFGQLSSPGALAQQQRDFASNYSLALATGGADKAAYADKLGAALPALSIALMDASSTRSSWTLATAKLYAQSETIAEQLATTASGMTYEAESLSLLGSIDLALGELDTNTSILKNAIDSGTSATAANLRVIATRLGGVPAFAGGGSHSGGIRLVGENGPELEVTGPSRIFTASQLCGVGGTGNTARLEALVEKLIEDNNNMRAELRSIASSSNKTAKILERVTPDGNSLQTVAA